MARTLTLDRAPVEIATIGTIQGYRLIVEVTEAESMPKEIFVYRAQMLDPFTRQQKAEFDHVAMPSDIEEVPVYGVTQESPLLLRLPTLDVLYRDKDELEQHWQDLQADVRFLVRQLGLLDDSELTLVEEETIGSMEDCQSSSSSEPEPSSSSSEPEPI